MIDEYESIWKAAVVASLCTFPTFTLTAEKVRWKNTQGCRCRWRFEKVNCRVETENVGVESDCSL